MCGIVAAFAYHTSADNIDSEELIRIRDAMTSRGPDGKGLWVSDNKRIGLAHRRLSIIDLSDAGSQPMCTSDGKTRIVLNGEIYNYQHLRSELVKKGHHFISDSDTEVLLHLYEEKGRDMVHDLRGMYAFAIWDDNQKALFMARDPFGIKPLYYHDDGKQILAASQVKAILKGKDINTSADPAGHAGFFLWGHVPEPYTLYKGIRALPAGASLWIESKGKPQLKSFLGISDIFRNSRYQNKTEECNKVNSILRDALTDSVRHHLIADVPVGIFLSSGLDSATLTALATESGHDAINTITLGFEEYKGTVNDETPVAEELSKHYGTRHQTVWVKKSDFRNEYERLMNAMDQPTIDGVNSYFVSLAANRTGLKAAISGIGGDELFGGYSSFSEIPKAVKHLKNFSSIPLLGKTFRCVSGPILKHLTSPKYAGLVQYGGTYGGAYMLRRGLFMPWELPELLGADVARQGWEELQPMLRLDETITGISDPKLKVSLLEMSWYMRNQLLRDADWAGMAHSLEIRTPFVDISLLSALLPLLSCRHTPGKKDMAMSPKKSLPHAILARKKTGFSVPVREWMSNGTGFRQGRGLRGWARDIYRKYNDK